MHIVMACGAMPFGPLTPMFRSLGGSETAALMLAKALAAKGHKVDMFCNLPKEGPDACVPGTESDGVYFNSLEVFMPYASATEHDLLIAVRDPRFLVFPAQCKKKVLWMHDIATKRGMQQVLDQMAWCVDELWTVSEWHRQQVHEATGYPLEFIKALRNGIVPCVDNPPPGWREDKTLLYAARPERGLVNLIREGGIMERLPEYKLKVAMYAHFPEDQRDFYNYVFKRMKELPNVEFVGSLSQPQLRQLISEATAYVYPTQFEETSCILARECIEQQTPFLTTRVGALPETLGRCGIFFEDWVKSADEGPYASSPGNDFWCQEFARFIREMTAHEATMEEARLRMSLRTDLYWDGVADLVEQNAQPRPSKLFSCLWSLLQDGDVMPAKALMQDHLSKMYPTDDLSVPLRHINLELNYAYRFADPNEIDAYYEQSYVEKGDTAETELVFSFDNNKSQRWQAIREQIAQLPPGSKVIEYGCGPGHVLAPLAKEFPLIHFTGCDVSESAVRVVQEGAQTHGLANLAATWIESRTLMPFGIFDAVICTEVLEHTLKPWETLTKIERLAKPGGKIIITVPYGSWEPQGYERVGHWGERYHLWSIDQQMFTDMIGGKPGLQFFNMQLSMDRFCRGVGNLAIFYNADHVEAKPVDALAKALRHYPRPTTAACVIAMNNEDTILRMLNSLGKNVQFVQFALGPSTDKTRSLIEGWFRARPWIRHKIIDVPKIEAWKFGFDDARNTSAQWIDDDFDWFLWIDTDEYLSGDFGKYLRNSALDGYLVAQHHFTVEPRGRAPEIDRPARLLRTGRGFLAKGHIHEHFEIPQGGPGMCTMLPDVDIGHTGYVNEEVRRSRFGRNFPLLEWDHATEGVKRPLHHFLWFRDLIHRMRFTGQKGDTKGALKLAEEAIAYYNAHTEEMSAFGPGLQMSLVYLNELYTVLGRGTPMKIAIGLEGGRQAGFETRFENFDQVVRVIKQLLEPEFKDRASKYY
jgi:SAM-dependent methyltransferase/glycosyltransferase involved in cell wall biosynthesis